MTFEEMLDHALAMLQRRGRMTYRALKLQFGLDDDHLEALTDELRYAHPQVVADNGRGLIWTGSIRPDPDAQYRPGPRPGAGAAIVYPHLSDRRNIIAEAVAHPGSLMYASLVIGLFSPAVAQGALPTRTCHGHLPGSGRSGLFPHSDVGLERSVHAGRAHCPTPCHCAPR